MQLIRLFVWRCHWREDRESARPRSGSGRNRLWDSEKLGAVWLPLWSWGRGLIIRHQAHRLWYDRNVESESAVSVPERTHRSVEGVGRCKCGKVIIHFPNSKVKSFGDNVTIEAEHANIMNPKFDLFFFKSFDIVFNALDNVKARQYVNSMCVMADIPLIEGGSTGLLGQSYPIIPHQTECYNCRPRGGEEGEKYAICTIRRYFYCSSPMQYSR